MDDNNLVAIEKVAKEHFLLHFREGAFLPCDIDISSVEAKLPIWYNEAKYKRGQKYFMDNRFGILNSNMVGLICLLAEPRGLKILCSTGRSSTVETARKRYVSTIIHTLTWYEYDLTQGSKSWESINKVRKMHFLASKSAENKKIGKISQSEISFTAFGFMGFVLLRPHILGIRHDNREDQEAFVHLWAVLLHMLGVQDKFNICLKPLEIVEMVCRMFLRYVIVPIIQLETPEFKHMVSVMLEGMSSYLPNMTYEVQMFQARRCAGVPGYQYGVDHEKEIHCRSILTQNEIQECNEIIYKITNSKYLELSIDIPIIDTINFVTIDPCIEIKCENEINIGTYKSMEDETSKNINNNKDYNVEINSISENKTNEMKPIDLLLPENISVRYVNYENDWSKNLNDSKFYEMSGKSQRIVKFYTNLLPYYENSIGRYIAECFLSLILFWLHRADKKFKGK